MARHTHTSLELMEVHISMKYRRHNQSSSEVCTFGLIENDTIFELDTLHIISYLGSPFKFEIILVILKVQFFH